MLLSPEKAIAPHSSTLPGKFHGWRSLVGCSPWGCTESDTTEATSLSLFTFMHWRRKWQPTPVFLPGESWGWGSLVGCRLWGRTELDTTEVTWQHVACSWQREDLFILLTFFFFLLLFPYAAPSLFYVSSLIPIQSLLKARTFSYHLSSIINQPTLNGCLLCTLLCILQIFVHIVLSPYQIVNSLKTRCYLSLTLTRIVLYTQYIVHSQ